MGATEALERLTEVKRDLKLLRAQERQIKQQKREKAAKRDELIAYLEFLGIRVEQAQGDSHGRSST